MMRVLLFASALCSVPLYASPVWADAERTAVDSRILLWSIQGDCSGAVTGAVSEELASASVQVERTTLSPAERQSSCMAGECAELLLARSSPESLRGALLLGGQIDEQEGASRYQLWLYSFDRKQTVTTVKSLTRSLPAPSLAADIARSARMLIQDFEQRCCADSEELKNPRLAECLPMFQGDLRRGSRPRSALFVAFNDAHIPTERQKQAQALQRLGSERLGRTLRERAELQVESYSGNAQALGSANAERQQAELRQRRKEFLIGMRWNGDAYYVQLCQNDLRDNGRDPSSASPLICRSHPQLVEENANETDFAKDVASRVHDLYAFATLPLPAGHRQCAPFSVAQCTPAAKPASGLLMERATAMIGPSASAAQPVSSEPPQPAAPPKAAEIATAPDAGNAKPAPPPRPVSLSHEPGRWLNNTLWTSTALGAAATISLGVLGRLPSTVDGTVDTNGQMMTFSGSIPNPFVSGAVTAGISTGIFLGISIAREVTFQRSRRAVSSK